MKNTQNYYLLLFSFFVLTACRKELAEENKFFVDPNIESVSLTMHVIGDAKYKWTANIEATLFKGVPKFYLTLWTRSKVFQDDPTQIRELLQITNLPLKKGEYKLESKHDLEKPYPKYYRTLDEGITDGEYSLDEKEKSWINLKCVDEKTNRIKGTFDLHFKLTQQGFFGTYPEKLHFCNASFDITAK